ncbi:hypothetical protein [Nostoc piscinale]|uniref:hypothetical protein n=1 Tax=Nostoc piscinale TaxID=224012 RepID=UPI000B211394|nr:hypothetical protein [Nostoc piscinale]
MIFNQQQVTLNLPFHKFNIKQISAILRRRRYLVLGVSFAAMSVISLVAINNKTNYQSSMQLLVTADANAGNTASNMMNFAGSEIVGLNSPVVDYTAQMKMLLSPQLIAEAVSLLKPEYPDITVEEIHGEQAKLSITRLDEKIISNNLPLQILEVTFSDEDPVRSQKVLQALQQVYQNYQLQQQKERLNKGLAFINARIPQMKKEVNQAEKKFRAFSPET